jgi:prepilin-type processing-associated H-X9-DG protein
MLPETRAGSYALNFYFIAKVYRSMYRDTLWRRAFLNESQVRHPTLTPVTADGLDYMVMPSATDPAPRNLVVGLEPPFTGPGPMWIVATPRHSQRGTPSRSWPQDQPLPGTVNVLFFDGHAEPVKLDRLWQLEWHVDYVPPLRRPGLP